ncbi:MAG: hypothetical protein GXP08_08330 [Gammaproteobacteria bacterium]|nr:hypothetical protein [Gammaproteobacteria bacterium]
MESTKTILIKGTLRILRPLIRILMRHEVSHREFAEIAKQAYVDVANQHFAIPNRKTTYTRVAVLTGLSRKEVMRLSKADPGGLPTSGHSLNRATVVIGGWLRDAEYLDKNNTPKKLPLYGEEASFEKLVCRYGGNVTVRAILDELERINAVSTSSDGSITLINKGYVPQHDQSKKIDIASSCTADLLETAVFNLDHNENEARFQRRVVYHCIPDHLAASFKQYSNKKSLDLLLDYNQWLADNQQQTPEDEKTSVKRVGVGIYYFENKQTNEGE